MREKTTHGEAFDSDDAKSGRCWSDDRGTIFRRGDDGELMAASVMRFEGWTMLTEEGGFIEDRKKKVTWEPAPLAFKEAFFDAVNLGVEISHYNTGRYSHRINGWKLEHKDEAIDGSEWVEGWPVSIHHLGAAWFYVDHKDAPPWVKMMPGERPRAALLTAYDRDGAND